jgi:hypothetical protein
MINRTITAAKYRLWVQGEKGGKRREKKRRRMVALNIYKALTHPP